MTSTFDGSEAVNDTIRATVRALRSAHRVDAAVLARYIGISRQALYNRLNGHAPWLAAEVAGLADFFGCSVQDLFEGTVKLAPQSGRDRNPQMRGAVTESTYPQVGAVGGAVIESINRSYQHTASTLGVCASLGRVRRAGPPPQPLTPVADHRHAA